MDSPGLDDSELLRRARVDANAFGIFYRRHARAVYRSLLFDCGDPDVALDLTAETFARALQSIGRFRGLRVTSGRAWIFAIANSMLSAVRARAPHRGSAPRAAWASSRRPSHNDDDSVVARMDAAAAARPTGRRPARAVGEPAERAPPAYRGRAPVRGVAVQLGCSPAAARQQASRGMRAADASASRGRSDDRHRSRRLADARARAHGSRCAARRAARRRRRRVVVLLAVAAPLLLAAAASVAGTQGLPHGVDEHLASLRDDRLESRRHRRRSMAVRRAGARPRATGRASAPGYVAGRRVTGYDDPGRTLLLQLRRATRRLHPKPG